MLKKLFIFPMAIVTLMTACNQNEATETKEIAVEQELASFDTSKYKALDLSQYNINRKLYISNGNSAGETINQSATGTIEIKVDEDYAIEIVPNPISIEEKKKELGSDPLFTINYIEENPDYIFYSKEIENSGIDPEYHFYLLLKDKNGPIAVKTDDMLQLNKEKAEAIFDSFKRQGNLPA